MHVCRTCSLNILKLKQPQKSSVICPIDLYLSVSHILIKYIEFISLIIRLELFYILFWPVVSEEKRKKWRMKLSKLEAHG